MGLSIISFGGAVPVPLAQSFLGELPAEKKKKPTAQGACGLSSYYQLLIVVCEPILAGY